MRNADKKRKQFIEEIEARQKNIVWPGLLSNSRRADYLIFKGSRNATPIQRIAIGLFGGFFLLAGISFVGISRDLHSVPVFIISILVLALGLRVIFNVFRGLHFK